MVVDTGFRPVTIASSLAEGAAFLTRHGIESARLNAEQLVAHCLQVSRLALYLKGPQTLTDGQVKDIQSAFGRRAKREPLQYIIGDQEFWGRRYIVTPGVFIPRPETEILVEETIRWLDQSQGERGPLTILDLCTGSGCIAISIAKYTPSARLYATDCSSRALEVARLNAGQHGLSDQVAFLRGDLFEPLMALGLEGRVDLILSNPPYVPKGSIRDLDPEVSLYEPREGLEGGADGLDCIRRLLTQAPVYLSNQGMVFLEIGDRQAVPLIQWLREHYPNAVVEFRLDLAGIQRVACIRFQK